MIYLFGSIVLISYLTLAFKMLERLGLNLFQSIVFNYLTCTITGAIVSGGWVLNKENITSGWFPWACLMGTMFIVLFNIIGITTQRISVAVASVANRLSLIIPVIFSIYLYNESLAALQWLGIALALIAVILTCLPNRQTEAKNRNNHALLYVLPAILFVGSGLLDTLIKYIEQAYLNDANKNAYLSSSFAVAATIGLIVLIVNLFTGKQKFDWRNVLAGIIIGIPNYFSIWFMVKFLQVSPWQSSAGIPINNMGIVLFSTLAAWVLFKERISRVNWFGIGLSAVAIGLIAFGDII